MSEPLWSDEAIAEALEKLGSMHVVVGLVRDSYEKCLAEIDTRLSDAQPGAALRTAQARIAQLEAALAETWQPVPAGEYTLGDAEQGYLHILDVLKDGDAIGVSDKEVLYYVDLSPDYRLCRKAATVAAEPVVVVDWSQYGEEYRWFAVDEDGAGWIYMYPPEISQNYWRVNTGSDFEDMIGNFNATDWRATLTERPNQPKGVTKV